MNPLYYPSLELCNKLTKSGFPETEKNLYSSFWWDFTTKNTVWMDRNIIIYKYPSVMELLDEMPIIINDDKQLYLVKHEDLNYSVKYWSKNWGSDFWTFNTLPNALAEMWLWLKENNYLTK